MGSRIDGSNLSEIRRSEEHEIKLIRDLFNNKKFVERHKETIIEALPDSMVMEILRRRFQKNRSKTV